jgi:CHAD domain-containing protein
MLRDRDRTAPPTASADSIRRWPSCLAFLKRIASSCVQAIESDRKSATSGNPDAVLRMRTEVTRLRAAALFFAPVNDNAEWPHIEHQLRWLNSLLGRSRNRDVVIEYANRKRYLRWSSQSRRSLLRSQDKAHRRLAQKLSSARYRRLASELNHWISSQNDQPDRLDQVKAYCDERLREWKDDISRQGRHVHTLGRRPLDRLRIQSRNYRYIVESLLNLDIPVSREDFSFCETAKRVHKTLGDLCDLRQLRKAVGRRPPHYHKRKHALIRRIEHSFQRQG